MKLLSLTISIILIPILITGQNIHTGINKIPDFKDYVKEIQCYKYSVKQETLTECKCYIYSDGIVIRKGNTIVEFTKVYSNVYKDNKGKLIEMIQNEKFYILVVNSNTYYLISKFNGNGAD